MSKRKFEPSLEGRGFSIRSYIKDLRQRRVSFMLGSDSKVIGSTDTGSCEAGCGKDSDPIKDVEIKEASMDCEKEEEKVQNSDLIKELDKDLTPPEGTSKTGYQPKGILKKPNNNGSGWDGEDSSQGTPPENVITVDNGELNNFQNTFPKRRARIAPCSRQKLVQVPGSFSYRRLLPYLTEMDKDVVQVSTTEEKSFAPNEDSRDSILAVNLDFSEIPVSRTSSLEITIPHLTEMDKDEVLVSSTEEKSVAPNVDSQESISIENLDFAEISVSRTSNLEKSESSTAPVLVSTDAQSTEICKPENTHLNSSNCIVENLEFAEIPVSRTSNLEKSEFSTASVLLSIDAQSTEIHKPEKNQSSSMNHIVENLDFAEIPVSKTSNIEKSEFSTAPVLVSTDAQSTEIHRSESTHLNSSNCIVEPQPPSDDSIQAMEKFCRPHPSLCSDQRTLTTEEHASKNVHREGETGISANMGEINNSDCKGICMCLDCVLFRNHAESSFEFTKKQLNEADEIIRGLVTEVCSLRHILEKSIGNRSSDSIQAYQNELMKVVCEKASLAEKLASMRTKQMFMDLNVQYKLQEARREFPDCIDQTTILSSIGANPRENS